MRPSSRFRPSKGLGQHFLVRPDIVREILVRGRFKDSDRVVEVGSGQGALTLPLAASVAHVVAVEKDARLTGWLGRRLRERGITNVTLIQGDILACDMDEIRGSASGRLLVAGNLPYNISTAVVEKLIESRAHLTRAVLMFQLEVAHRLTASPGEKAYGALTLMVRYHAQATPLLGVPRGAFYPTPKVDSMVVELDFERPYPRRALSEGAFKEAVRGAFAHRRKTVINSLCRRFPALGRDRVIGKMEACGIDPGSRAEALDMEAFLCIADALSLTKGDPGDS